MKASVDDMASSIMLWPNQMPGAITDTETVDDKGHVRSVSVARLVPFLPPASQANGTAIILHSTSQNRDQRLTGHLIF